MVSFFEIIPGIAHANAAHISPKNGYMDESDINRILGVETPLIIENEFNVKTGKKFYDILRFMDAGNFAISEKVKVLLQDGEITGWTCFPIKIENAPDSIDEYFAFQLTSKSAGEIINLEKLNNYEEDFIKFDRSTWDGSDLFTLKNTAVLVCTSKVKELLEIGKITNIEFRPIITE